MPSFADLEVLVETLARAGHPLELLSLPDGGRMAVLPYGGRILGLWPANCGNVLWTNPALPDPARAHALLHGAAWPNSGGDRCWLAPELALFFVRERPDADPVYRVPAGVDPGNYALERHGDGLLVRQRARVRIAGHEAVAVITRRCTALPDPRSGSDLAFAGYSLTTSLALEAPPEVRLGLWQLLQCPAPGVLLLDTHGTAEPSTVVGTPAPGEIRAEPGLLRWRMHAGPTKKITVLARQVTGRAGHLRRLDDGRWQLVVRNFSVDPAGDYCDPLWSDPTRTGFAFQACLVDEAALGRFNEIEHHSPAAVGGGPTVEDRSAVWSWTGQPKAMAATVAALFPGAAGDPLAF